MHKRLLHLTAQERAIFDSLPEKLREGWEMEEEKFTYHDTPERMRMRIELMRVHDPKLLEFQKKASQVRSREEFLILAKSTDLSGVSHADLAELFFVLGPEPVSLIVQRLLQEAKADVHLELLVALTAIRHAQLSSMHPSVIHP